MTQPSTEKELVYWIKRAEMTYAAMGIPYATLIRDYFNIKNSSPELSIIEILRIVIDNIWGLWFKISCPEKLN